VRHNEAIVFAVTGRPHDCPFVSRAGYKLDHALREFNLDVSGLVCADFGCNIGGFTDCLLQRGAAKVYAIDTGYGTLAWKLRNDSRVVVMERTNALHASPPPLGERRGGSSGDVSPITHEAETGKVVPVPTFGGGVDLVVIDLAWTPQRLAIPAALRWLQPTKPSPQPLSLVGGRERGFIITLVKPHYELSNDEKRTLLHDGRLDPNEAERVLQRVLTQMPEWGVEVMAHTRSPITGGKSSKGAGGAGNVEFLVLARPSA
jgi:23S rRNA (cytidine1920-2'-O)/16S rRNA (cytidine1409-2'-O)-methyltransferase